MLLLQASAPGGTAAERVAPLDAMVADAVGCRKPRVGEITVCARRGGESPYRYRRLPGEDDGFKADGPTDSVSRERHRLMDVGGAGAQTNACSTTGPMGWTGCQVKQWKEAQQQAGFRSAPR